MKDFITPPDFIEELISPGVDSFLRGFVKDKKPPKPKKKTTWPSVDVKDVSGE